MIIFLLDHHNNVLIISFILVEVHSSIGTDAYANNNVLNV